LEHGGQERHHDASGNALIGAAAAPAAAGDPTVRVRLNGVV
jgi:predicted RecA/RadA family phage recombinase